jgi:hypothetical protein
MTHLRFGFNSKEEYPLSLSQIANARLVAPGICVLHPDLMIADWE